MVASIKPHRDELGLGDGRMLIDGDWVAAADEATWSHRHPATGEQVAEFPVATPADVDRAVRAARRAFDEGPWPRSRAGERVRVLRTIANLVREHADELLRLQALDNSVPPEVTSAPLINTRQLDRVLGLIARGQEEGARLVCGGGRAEGDELAQGNFVAPTLFADVSNDMSIAREEIFGPVLSVIPFDNEEEAVRLANDTDYGLAATVWASDVRRAMRMTKAIKAGTVGINGYQLEPNSPFGGFRQSGLGREGGRAAVESYTELKTVLLPFTDEMM
jgi:acyl-CoA reductase-like NAD-dependent aldehyde dehydrogenase